MRQKIFDIIEKDKHDDRASEIYDFFMIAVIIVSIVPLMFKTEYHVFDIMDWVTTGIFCIDYILRWITADLKYPKRKRNVLAFIKYPFTFMALMDLLSIAPTFLAMFAAFKMLKIFRLLRAMKVLRIFKATRYSKNMEIISGVIKESRSPLIAVGSLAAAYILIAALVVFNVEMETFDNFFHAVYWATVSLTTVGYGDVYPVTVPGQIVTMLSAFVGIAVVALPAGIITAGYMKAIQENHSDKKRKKRKNSDETVDETEDETQE